MRKIVILGCICVLTMFSYFSLPTFTHAGKSLTDIKQERKDIKKDLSVAEKKVADILTDIDDMNQEIQVLDGVLEQNKKEIQKTEDEIKELKKQIKKLEEKIEERFEILQVRAKSYQENGGNINFLDVIFNAKNFNEFISRVSAISKITDADANLIKEQERDKQKVDDKLGDVEELQAELESKRDNIKSQKEDKQKTKQHLEEKQNELHKTVENLEMKDDELSGLEDKLVSKQDGGITFAANSGSGELGWPTDGGYISSPMGARWGRTHRGIDIARTDRSTIPPIYAAEAGTVEYAGAKGSYGNMVLINHGNNMKTLYGHMSSIKVSNGQKVDRGQQIGVMGSTGRSTGIHVHFEVQINGDIQNPIGYLN